MIKKCLLFLLISSNMLCVTGCWDRTELNDLAIVEGVGIDRTDDKMIELSAQVTVPRAMGGGQGTTGGGEQNRTLVRAGKGKTIVDAYAGLQAVLPRKVFWGHTKVIVIGKRLAKEGIGEKIEFFAGHPQPRPRSYVFVSKGSAKDVLTLLPPIERSSSELLREMAKSQSLLGVTFIDFIGMLSGDAGAAALPMLDILPPEQGQKQMKTIAYIKRTGIFKKDKMIGDINEKVTRGVLWLRNEIREALFTVKPKEADGDISIKVVRAKTELIPFIEDGKWKMTVKARSEGEVILNGSSWNLMNSKFIKLLEDALEKDLNNRMEVALQKVQKEKKADILGFGEAFHLKYPGEWKKNKDRWQEIFPMVEVTFDTKVYVRRPGKTNSSLVVPKEEVEKK